MIPEVTLAELSVFHLKPPTLQHLLVVSREEGKIVILCYTCGMYSPIPL